MDMAVWLREAFLAVRGRQERNRERRAVDRKRLVNRAPGLPALSGAFEPIEPSPRPMCSRATAARSAVVDRQDLGGTVHIRTGT